MTRSIYIRTAELLPGDLIVDMDVYSHFHSSLVIVLVKEENMCSSDHTEHMYNVFLLRSDGRLENNPIGFGTGQLKILRI